ncbi:organomercurial lyase [Microbacterium lacticum]
MGPVPDHGRRHPDRRQGLHHRCVDAVLLRLTARQTADPPHQKLEPRPLLDRPARVESISPASGDTIRVTVDSTAGVTSVEPATAVVSLVSPEAMHSIRSSFCNQVHYFASREDATGWLTEHPMAQILTVADAFEVGSTLITEMLERPRTGADELSGSCCGPETCC